MNFKINISKKTLAKGFKKRKSKKIVTSKATFDKKVAVSFHDLGFYECEQDRLKWLKDRDKEKASVSTSDKEIVTQKIEEFRSLGATMERKVFQILDNIKNRNIACIKAGKELPTHSDLLNIIANPYVLCVAYRSIRKNKGALTEGFVLPSSVFKNLTPSQQSLLKKTYYLPDGQYWDLVKWVSKSILTGTYVWGASRRVWIPKPGTKKLRPITIPPFVDRMVQAAIRMVLEPIYEPTFVAMNCSFGFRAGNGVHESLVKLKERRYTQGFHMAVEGDIEQAYPNLDNDILLSILGERIKDQRFLNFLRKRLHLTLFDETKGKYEDSFLGIPQGGIDSPYLFNIYLLGMDKFIIDFLDKECCKLNKNRNPKAEGKLYVSYKNQIDILKERTNKIRSQLKAIYSKSVGLSYEQKIELEKKQESIQEQYDLSQSNIRLSKIKSCERNNFKLLIFDKVYNVDSENRTYICETTKDYFIKAGGMHQGPSQ